MTRQDPPLAGVLRVVYFLCISLVSLFAVVTGVFGFYHDPHPDQGDVSVNIFSPTSVVEGVTVETNIDHFLTQATQENVYSIQIIGDTVRYELYTGTTIYETQLPEGQTLDDILGQAGVDSFDIPLIDDSLAGEGAAAATEDDGDYERNIMIILGALSAALFAAAVLGLGRRFNPLRAGLLAGGMLAFLVAMVYWGDASNDWLGFVVSIVTFAIIAGVYPFLEDGLPLQRREEPPSSGGIAFTPGPPSSPPPYTPPPPPE